MKKKVIKLFTFVLALFLAINYAQALDLKKFKNPIKKKPKPEKIRMVETEEEYKVQSQNVPVEQRQAETYKEPQTTKDYYYPKAKYRFERYNHPAGSKEADLSGIEHEPVIYSKLVADSECHYAAFSEYYYTPDINQISSNFYVTKLDTTKVKVKRFTEYNPLDGKKKLVLESGTKERYKNLFNSLTLVDWNKSANKLVVKEKIGSVYGGIYKTKIYVYYMEEDFDKGYMVRLSDLDGAIKHYLSYVENINLDKYIYELSPLGFSADNDSLLVLNCYLYDKNNKRIFMGVWGYNCDTYETLLISRDNPSVDLSANGIILEQVVD